MRRPPQRLRWGVIGTGTISQSFVPDLQWVGEDVRIVHSRDASKAKRFAADFAVPRSTGDIDAVLHSGDVDAVYIATPFATHHALARRALLAGKHVLVEKPMALSAAEVEDLFAIARARRLFLMEAMWMKFNPAFRRLREEIAAGTIGEVRSVRAAFAIPIPDDAGSRWDPARSGGALLDQGIYPVALAHAILGVPSAVHASGVVRADGLDLSEHFTLEFAGGRYAQAASSMVEFGDLSAAINGTQGWIVLPTLFWTTTSLEIHAGDTRRIFGVPDRIDLPREGNGFVPMIREVADAIAAGLLEHPAHTRDDTVEVFRILDEIRRRLTASV